MNVRVRTKALRERGFQLLGKVSLSLRQIERKMGRTDEARANEIWQINNRAELTFSGNQGVTKGI
jgi:hypothetical protein